MRRHHAGFVLGALCCASSLLFAATEHTRGPLTASRPCLVRFAIPFFPPCCSLVPSLFSLYMFGAFSVFFLLFRHAFCRVVALPLTSTYLTLTQIYYATDKDMVEDYELQVPLREMFVI